MPVRLPLDRLRSPARAERGTRPGRIADRTLRTRAAAPRAHACRRSRARHRARRGCSRSQAAASASGDCPCRAADGAPSVQAGLFDSRALKEKSAARRTSRCHPPRKRGSTHICSRPTRASDSRTIPSSSCSSSYARRAERLARIALLRRANSAAGILRPARRRLAGGSRKIVHELVADPGLPARAGIEHPIDLGFGRRPACRAPWLYRSFRPRRRPGHSTHATDGLERTHRARRRDVERLARQPVA